MTDKTRTGDWAGLSDLAAIKRYIASLTQAGTAAPTATVLLNSLGAANPTLARTGVGTYTVTLTGAFPAGKVNAPSRLIPGGGTVEIVRTSNNALTITTKDGTGTPADALLTGFVISVEVYP